MLWVLWYLQCQCPRHCTLEQGLIQGEGLRKSFPKRHRVTGQIRRTKNYNLQRENVIISLPYIVQAKQGAKHTKKSPRPEGTHTRQYNMILVVQIVHVVGISTTPQDRFPAHRTGHGDHTRESRIHKE